MSHIGHKRWRSKLRRNQIAARARKRMEGPMPERPEKLVPYYPLELGVRDTRTGDVEWVPFKSVRDAARRLAVVRKYYL